MDKVVPMAPLGYTGKLKISTILIKETNFWYVSQILQLATLRPYFGQERTLWLDTNKEGAQSSRRSVVSENWPLATTHVFFQETQKPIFHIDNSGAQNKWVIYFPVE